MKIFRYFLFISLLLANHNCLAQEICDNGKDDDGDGLVDLQDPDCQCHYQASGNLLQNASFESYSNCPSNHSYEYDSKIVDHWQYGTYTNINEAEYYHNFNCLSDSAQVMLFLPPSLPLPDGKAFISIRQYVYRKPDMQEKDIAKVYVGQCLPAPLQPGKQYTLSFSAGRFKSNDDANYKYKSAPFTVAIFGHADCNAVPFGEVRAYSNGCPSNYPGWVLLGKMIVHSKGKWVQSRIDFTVPSDINVIEIGPDCSIINPDGDLADNTTYSDFYVYYLDDLHLLLTKDFHFASIKNQDGSSCIADSVLSAPNVANASFQWYKNNIAIIGATGNSYHADAASLSDKYSVRITTSDSCFISEPFSLGASEFNKLSLPADTSFCETDTMVLAPSLKGVTYNWNGNTGSIVQVFEAGIYNIEAFDVTGCDKKFTVNVRSQNCKIYVPNAFTPNGDGLNDIFRIPPQAKIQLEEFSVFDLLGNKVFSTTNSNIGWDGRCKGQINSIGTYVYIIRGVSDNKKIRLKGIVNLIR